MAPSKAERPAIARAMKRGAWIDLLASSIDPEATLDHPIFQAAIRAPRAGSFDPALLAVLTSLAIGEVRL